MNRTQLLAALVLAVAIGGLLFSQLRGGTELNTGSDTESDAESDTDSAAESMSQPTGETADTVTDSSSDAVDDQQDGEQSVEPQGEQAEAPPVLDDKPPLSDIDGWINTDATSLDDFAGQVRVVEFWTFGCFNCKNRLPHTKELYADYKDQGLEIIGVHAPEFERERDPDAVFRATEDLGVIWPVALDTDKTNFRAWQKNRRFWPRVYVLDQNGNVRYDHIGEGDYDGLEETVAYLIENGP